MKNVVPKKTAWSSKKATPIAIVTQSHNPEPAVPRHMLSVLARSKTVQSHTRGAIKAGISRKYAKARTSKKKKTASAVRNIVMPS
jgi:hypothetical protein